MGIETHSQNLGLKIWFQIDEDKHIYKTVWKIISRELWPQIIFLTIKNNNITFIVNLTFIVHHSLYSSIKSIFLWCFGFAEVHVASMVKGLKVKGWMKNSAKKRVFVSSFSRWAGRCWETIKTVSWTIKQKSETALLCKKRKILFFLCFCNSTQNLT